MRVGLPDFNGRMAFDQPAIHRFDIGWQHADATQRGVVTDAARLDRAVNAEADFADGFARQAFQPDPVLADRIAWIIGSVTVAGTRIVPRGVLQLADDAPGAGRRSAIGAEADGEAANECVLDEHI